MITHGNKQISEIVYARKASEGGGAVRLTNIIRGAQVVFGDLYPEIWWLTGATKAAILAAFGQTDGKAVIKATNAYLNALAATDKTKATALAGFINQYPVNWGTLLVDFQPVEYIEKPTGTTIWVNTGIKPKQGDIEEIECDVAWNRRNGNNVSVIIGVSETSSYIGYSLEYSSKYNLIAFGISTGVSLADNAFHTIKANTSEGTYVDGVLYEHTPVASKRSYTNEQQLFNKYSNGYEIEHFFGKQKQMIAKINGSLAAWFVPCYNKTSNLIGMYDVVKGTMACTGGSGAFLKGANVIINTT